MRKTIWLACFLVLLNPVVSSARVSSALTIRVIDSLGAAVAGAAVRLYTRDDRLRLTVRTNAAGVYRFDSLAPGEYLVDAEAPGFARAEARIVRLKRGEEAEIELTLTIAAHREEVVVTASSTPQTVTEISKAITNVAAPEIDERNEYSIPEALRSVPGLRVQELGGPGSFVSIKTRGLRNEDTAVLIDGARFRDPTAPQGDASAYLQDLVVTDTDRVEVLRGSSSSLYGTNAIGGVINIVTRDGGGRPRGSLFSEGGSLGFFRARGQVGGGAADDRLTYSAGLSYLNVSEGLDGNDAARNTSGQGRIRARLSPTATLSFRFYAADANAMLNESPQGVGVLPPAGVIDAIPLSDEELARYESGTPISDLNLDGANYIPAADDLDNQRENRFVSTLVTFEQRPRETFGYSVTYHGLGIDRGILDGPVGVTPFEPGETSLSDFNGRTHTVNGRVDFDLGAFNFVTAGYELERESYLNQSFMGSTLDSGVDVAQTSSTFFVQDQLRLVEGALQISGAFRTQLFSLETPTLDPPEGSPYQGVDFESPENAYTGDASVAYFFRDSGTKLRAHVGSGYRAPSLFERFGTFYSSFFGYSVYGDPRLRPEKSVAFDAGVDQDFAAGRARASATFFYTRLQRVIIFDFSGGIDPTTDPYGRFGGYRGVDGGVARGIELSATAATEFGLRAGIAYTYTDAEPPAEGFEELPQAYAIPENQLSLVATQRVGTDFYINFDLAVSDSYLAPIFDPVTFASRSYRFDGMVKADLGASYTFRLAGKGLRFFAKVANLFNEKYYESGFRTLRRTGVAGVVFEF
jgi:iron complex outermembrane receptor protein